jgi:hypothetical protein
VNGAILNDGTEQIVGRERNQRACHRQLVRNVVDRRRVNSTVRLLPCLTGSIKRNEDQEKRRSKMKRVLLLSTAIVAAGMFGTNGLAQGQAPSLEQALSRVRSGMEGAGLKSVENTPEGQKIYVTAFRLLVFDSCSIQIQMTTNGTASPGRLGGVSTFTYTVPLGKLDFQKIRVTYDNPYSREGNSTFVTSLTSSRDGEKGYATLILPTIGEQKTISYVFVGDNRNARTRAKNPDRVANNITSLQIDFKYKKDAENVATAFAEASRLCSAIERTQR